MNRKLIYAVILLVALGAVALFVFKGELPFSSSTPAPSGSPLTSSSPNKTDKPAVGPNPASCKLQGEIKFINQDLYNNGDAKFTYNGVDHPARLITWTITPNDKLSVGPNIFNQLPLPEGESLLFITLPANPIAKKYELTASINYGRTVDDVFKLFNADCKGKVTVVLP